jgi:hypothetical protein
VVGIGVLLKPSDSRNASASDPDKLSWNPIGRIK